MTDELQALNLCLLIAKRAAVSDLEGVIGVDQQVRTLLEQAGLRVCLQGWPSNTLRRKVSPTADGRIYFSSNTLSVEVVPDVNGFTRERDSGRYVLRPKGDGSVLYDTRKGTDVLKDTTMLEVEVSVLLPWESRPEHMTQLVLAIAKLETYRLLVGEGDDRGLQRDLAMAQSVFERLENRARVPNLFDPPHGLAGDDPRRAVWREGVGLWQA